MAVEMEILEALRDIAQQMRVMNHLEGYRILMAVPSGPGRKDVRAEINDILQGGW